MWKYILTYILTIYIKLSLLEVFRNMIHTTFNNPFQYRINPLTTLCTFLITVYIQPSIIMYDRYILTVCHRIIQTFQILRKRKWCQKTSSCLKVYYIKLLSKFICIPNEVKVSSQLIFLSWNDQHKHKVWWKQLVLEQEQPNIIC